MINYLSLCYLNPKAEQCNYGCYITSKKWQEFLEIGENLKTHWPQHNIKNLLTPTPSKSI